MEMPVDILDRLLNLPSLALAILKIRIYVADYVLSKVCDLTHQFEFKWQEVIGKWKLQGEDIHNGYSVSNVCLRILVKYLLHNLLCNELWRLRYASAARSELAQIEIFVNPAKIKSALIRLRPICFSQSRGQVRLDYLRTLRCFLRYVLIYT